MKQTVKNNTKTQGGNADVQYLITNLVFKATDQAFIGYSFSTNIGETIEFYNKLMSVLPNYFVSVSFIHIFLYFNAFYKDNLTVLNYVQDLSVTFVGQSFNLFFSLKYDWKSPKKYILYQILKLNIISNIFQSANYYQFRKYS